MTWGGLTPCRRLARLNLSETSGMRHQKKKRKLCKDKQERDKSQIKLKERRGGRWQTQGKGGTNAGDLQASLQPEPEELC